MTATTHLNLTHWASSQNQPEVTVNEALDGFDGLADALVHNMASDANYTLATTGTVPYEWQHLVIQITDTSSVLTATRFITCPDYVRTYIFINSTKQSLQLKNSGSGITVPAMNTAILRSDGSDVVRVWQPWEFTQTANKTVTNTTAETSLIGTGIGQLAFQTDFLVPGKTIRVKARGINSTAASAGTLTFRLKLGSTVIVASATNTATNNLTNRGWEIDCELTCRTTGASGTVRGQGTVTRSTSATAHVGWSMESTADITIDTTASQTVDLTVQWGTASASNTITCTNMSIQSIN